jgi:acyl-CoA thioester hydrolase
MPETFRTHRRIEFCETDAAGIAHFASYLCYMEQAEHEFLRSLGLSVSEDQGDGTHLSWPRVHVECDFRGTAKFEDILQIDANVVRLGNKSVTYGFEFSRGGDFVATGRVVAVCCLVRPASTLTSVSIPDKFIQQLKRFLL